MRRSEIIAAIGAACDIARREGYAAGVEAERARAAEPLRYPEGTTHTVRYEGDAIKMDFFVKAPVILPDGGLDVAGARLKSSWDSGNRTPIRPRLACMGAPWARAGRWKCLTPVSPC